MNRLWTVLIAMAIVASMPNLSPAPAAEPKPAAKAPPKPAPSAPAAAATPKASPDQKAAALELLDTMNMEKVVSDSINVVLEMQMKQSPQIAQFRPVMENFFKKYMSWDVLKDEMVNLYAEEFTAPELNQLTAFYKTPLGKKLAEKQPILMSKGGAMGQRRVQEHIGELQEAIKAEMQKNGGNKKPAGGPAKSAQPDGL